jgi:hypothetical protein
MTGRDRADFYDLIKVGIFGGTTSWLVGKGFLSLDESRVSGKSWKITMAGRDALAAGRYEVLGVPHGYYVDEGSGKVCSTAVAPEGFRFEVGGVKGFQKVALVAKKDSEVVMEAVFWPSIESMVSFGISVPGP